MVSWPSTANVDLRLFSCFSPWPDPSAFILEGERLLNRGPRYVKELFRRMKDIETRLREAEVEFADNPDELQRLRARMRNTLDNPWGKNERDKNLRESFKRSISKSHVRSTKEKITGHDLTPLERGEIQLGKISQMFDGKPTMNLTYLRMELFQRQRGIRGATDEDLVDLRKEIDQMGIKMVKKQLAAAEKALCENGINPKTGEKYDARFIYPLFTDNTLYQHEHKIKLD